MIFEIFRVYHSRVETYGIKELAWHCGLGFFWCVFHYILFVKCYDCRASSACCDCYRESALRESNSCPNRHNLWDRCSCAEQWGRGSDVQHQEQGLQQTSRHKCCWNKGHLQVGENTLELVVHFLNILDSIKDTIQNLIFFRLQVFLSVRWFVEKL